MKKKIVTILLIMIYMLLVNFNCCYAVNNTLSTSKTSVSAGETFEVYISLPTDSIGYDLKVLEDNKDLIKSSEITENIGTKKDSRLYLIQMVGSADRIVHKVGTKVAIIKYTIADEVSDDTKLTINISGEVAGQTSSERNSVNESVTINVIKTTKEPVIEDEKEDNKEDTNKENDTKDENIKEDDKTKEESKEINTTKDNTDKTVSPNKIPKTGINKNILLIVLISVLLISNGIIYVKHKKMKY